MGTSRFSLVYSVCLLFLVGSLRRLAAIFDSITFLFQLGGPGVGWWREWMAWEGVKTKNIYTNWNKYYQQCIQQHATPVVTTMKIQSITRLLLWLDQGQLKHEQGTLGQHQGTLELRSVEDSFGHSCNSLSTCRLSVHSPQSFGRMMHLTNDAYGNYSKRCLNQR